MMLIMILRPKNLDNKKSRQTGRDIEITLDLPVLPWRIEGYLISLVGSAIYITSFFLQIEETRRVLLHTP